jgi:CHAD domain-containing protein
VRIECKKLRYAAEFFGSLFGHADDLLARLERVQDALGEYNDLRVQSARLSALLRAESAAAPGAIERAAAIGAALAALERRRAKSRARCEERLAELAGRGFVRAVERITAGGHPQQARSEA